MRRTKKSHAMRAVALALGLLISVWGVGTSQAQEHHGGHHGGHGGHDSTTTTGGGGGSSTTRPGGSSTTKVPLRPGERETAIKYGPYRFEAAPPANGDPHTHWHSGNRFQFLVQKPCNNCYITGMVARLVGPDGQQTIGHTPGRAQMHHMLLANTDADKTDATCEWGVPFPLGALFGQRFFASGDERTPMVFPPGYGYHVGTGAWNLIWEGAHQDTVAKNVYYEVTFRWVPDNEAQGYKNLEPIWFDVAQCGFSTFTAPAGPSTKAWTWTVNRPGVITNIGGHCHDGCENIEIRNDSTGQLICDSRAGYGESPLFIDHHGDEHLSSMSKCGGEAQYAPAGAPITNGQRITITGHYNQAEQITDQMGIVMAFVGEPSSGGGGSGACETATNAQHVAAGRATSWLLFAWAKGSNNYLGMTSATTSLREGPTGTWTRVASC
jgi:hypothetical protein